MEKMYIHKNNNITPVLFIKAQVNLYKRVCLPMNDIFCVTYIIFEIMLYVPSVMFKCTFEVNFFGFLKKIFYINAHTYVFAIQK